jgi:hypothetical protein
MKPFPTASPLFDRLGVDGKKAVKYIYRKEEAYNGSFITNAPDLILTNESKKHE